MRNRLTRSLRQALIALGILALAACGDSAPAPDGPPPSVTSVPSAPPSFMVAPRASTQPTPEPGGTAVAAVTTPTAVDARAPASPTPTAVAPPAYAVAPAPEPAERINLLVLGVDQAESFVGNTDVIMIVSIDAETDTILVLSLPRDLCLGACDGHSSRINEVYKRQGIEALKEALRYVTGLNIDHWMLVNFHGVEAIINQLGGVRVWSNREFDERFIYLDTEEEVRLILEEGWNTLNGREAVAYGRSRKYDSGGDFARICRQQQVVRALREQSLSPSLLVNAPALLASLSGAFRTDFPIGSVPALGNLLLAIPQEQINSWAVHARGHDLLIPVEGLDGANLLRPDLHAIRDFVQDSLIESTQAHLDDQGNATFVSDNCEGYFP
ncbi:MAG: LCP family protein [Chloroflexota bacterium]|nr:LCP family protein [Chloroflexota bacterium]